MTRLLHVDFLGEPWHRHFTPIVQEVTEHKLLVWFYMSISLHFHVIVMQQIEEVMQAEIWIAVGLSFEALKDCYINAFNCVFQLPLLCEGLAPFLAVSFSLDCVLWVLDLCHVFKLLAMGLSVLLSALQDDIIYVVHAESWQVDQVQVDIVLSVVF